MLSVVLAATLAVQAAQSGTAPPAAASSAAPLPVGPESTAQAGVTRYAPSFFEAFRPATALDMVQRLPGFSLDDGAAVRGYSGAGGNVLIDGRRAASKSDTTSSMLSRINVGDVDRIELIRGGAAGVDMQGRTLLANVVRRSADSSTVVATAGIHLFQDGRTIPNATLSVTKRSKGRTYDFTLSRFASFDDSVGDGRYTVRNPTAVVRDVQARTGGGGGGTAANAAYKGPLFGGDLRVNGKLQQSYFKSGQSYGEFADLEEVVSSRSRDREGEIGVNYDRRIGAIDVEAVALQRLKRSFSAEEETGPGVLAQFSGVRRTGESIGRLSGRYTSHKTLTLEAGGELAFNVLDGSTRFQLNGQSIPLPSADVRVEETRGEGFGQLTWRPRESLTFEAGVRLETSTIAETGDVALERSFFYVKPRFAMSWAPDKNSQVRLRIEKKVGQLDFGNFISSTDLAQDQVNAGNPELRPDQRWQYEAAYERRFLGRGSVVVTYTHETIDDAVDLVPIIGPGFAFDAPGNIGSGTLDTLDIQATAPLDRFKLKGGQIKAKGVWRNSEITDPLTGEQRRISEQRPYTLQLQYTQDVPKLKSTFGVSYDRVFTETSYRLAEVTHVIVTPPFLQIFGEYTPRANLLFRLELTNLVPYTLKYQQDIYAGPRNVAALLERRELRIQSQPRIYLRVRKTF